MDLHWSSYPPPYINTQHCLDNHYRNWKLGKTAPIYGQCLHLNWACKVNFFWDSAAGWVKKGILSRGHASSSEANLWHFCHQHQVMYSPLLRGRPVRLLVPLAAQMKPGWLAAFAFLHTGKVQVTISTHSNSSWSLFSLEFWCWRLSEVWVNWHIIATSIHSELWQRSWIGLSSALGDLPKVHSKVRSEVT